MKYNIYIGRIFIFFKKVLDKLVVNVAHLKLGVWVLNIFENHQKSFLYYLVHNYVNDNYNSDDICFN